MCQGEILNLVDINMLDKKEVEDKTKKMLNLVDAGEDRDESIKEFVDWVLNNFRSQRLCDYLANESNHCAMERAIAHENKVFDLVNAQLEYARQKHGGKFHSRHEGWAVMLEEFEEAEDVMKILRSDMEEIWTAIKEDDYVRVNDLLEDIRIECNNGIVELSQVSAVVQKMIDSFKEDEKYEAV